MNRLPKYRRFKYADAFRKKVVILRRTSCIYDFSISQFHITNYYLMKRKKYWETDCAKLFINYLQFHSKRGFTKHISIGFLYFHSPSCKRGIILCWCMKQKNGYLHKIKMSQMYIFLEISKINCYYVALCFFVKLNHNLLFRTKLRWFRHLKWKFHHVSWNILVTKKITDFYLFSYKFYFI